MIQQLFFECSLTYRVYIGLSPLPGFQWQMKVYRDPLLQIYSNNPGGDWHPGQGGLSKVYIISGCFFHGWLDPPQFLFARKFRMQRLVFRNWTYEIMTFPSRSRDRSHWGLMRLGSERATELLPQVSKKHILEEVGRLESILKTGYFTSNIFEGERFGIFRKHANPRRTWMVQVITHES